MGPQNTQDEATLQHPEEERGGREGAGQHPRQDRQGQGGRQEEAGGGGEVLHEQEAGIREEDD